MRPRHGVTPALLLSLWAACAHPAVPPRRAATLADSLPVDHVILAIDSLERGVSLLRRATGVTPVSGGAHPGRGTQNALLRLGEHRYLELLAPNPGDTSSAARQSASERARYFSAFREPAPAGWALHVPDAEAEQRRLRARGLPAGEVVPGSRARPDGTVLHWRTLDPWGSHSDALPFVIEWAAGSKHPSTNAPSGCQLAMLAIGSPAPESLRTLFRRAGYPVMVRAAAREQLEFVLDCPTGRVHFP